LYKINISSPHVLFITFSYEYLSPHESDYTSSVAFLYITMEILVTENKFPTVKETMVVARDFLFSISVQTSLKTHPASYTMGTGALS
jgi:hypothetical protein